MCVQVGAGQRELFGELRRQMGLALTRKPVEFPCEVQRPLPGDRKLLEPGAGELVTRFPTLVAYAATYTPTPLLWNTCFIQKQAVELLSRPIRAR